MKFLSFILLGVVACASARPESIDPYRIGGSSGGIHNVPHVQRGVSRGSSTLRGLAYGDDLHAGVSYGSAPHPVVSQKDVSYSSSSGPAVLHGSGYDSPKRVTITHDSGYEGPKRVTVTHGTGYEGPKGISVSRGPGYEDPHRSSGYVPPVQNSVYRESNSYSAPQKVSVHGDSGYGTSQYSSGGDYGLTPPKYEFGYGVSDDYHGTNFGHTESRDGYLTKGEYYVDLPDGRRQKVSYYVDEWGYHPTVTYEGKAQYPNIKTPIDGGYH